jgi:DNA N-6-adenine-methyltransferase (Dam)
MPRLSTSTKRHKPSFLESGKIPTLGQMIRDARGDQQVIRRSTQQALRAWFRQSERLNTARREYRLRGPRFVDFARRIGVTDQSSAYHLVHLQRYRVQIISRCENDATAATKRGQIYRYPGWETALGWFHPTKRRGSRRSGRYWLTPSALWRKLDDEFHFDYDPCPCPMPKGFNALIRDWGQTNYVNPPFSKRDVVGGTGVTAFVRKAIAEQKKGKTSVIVLPVFDYVTVLLDAGAEIRPLGRVPFLDVDSRRAASHPPNIAVFILRPVRR